MAVFMSQKPSSSSVSSPGSFSFFGTRRFLPLFVVQFLGAFNDNFFKNAFVILVTIYFAEVNAWGENGVEIATQIIAALFAAPFFFFSAFAGQISDKLEKARLVQWNRAAEILIVLFGAAALITLSQYLLYITIFLYGTQSAFFGPLKYALLPHHLREDELVGGNAIFEAATYVAIIGGTYAGMKFISMKSESVQFVGTYYVSLIMLVCALAAWASSIFIPQAQSQNKNLKVNWNLYVATRDLIRFTARRRGIFLTILGISWFWLIGVFWLTLTPGYVKKYLFPLAKDAAEAAMVANDAAITETVQIMMLVFAVGIGAGSMWCNRLLRGEVSAKFVPLAGLANSFFMLIVALVTASFGNRYLTETFAFASWTGAGLLVGLFGIAVCGGVFSVPLYALMQKWAPPAHRSRVIAANNVINALFMLAVAVICAGLYALGASSWLLILILTAFNLIISIYIITLVPEAVIHTFLRWLLIWLFKVEVRGVEHFKEAGRRRVIIANHTSYLDAILLGAFLPERPTFAIDTSFMSKWWMKPVIWLNFVNLYPVDPSKPMAIKALTALARTGVPVVIFPEGRLTVTGTIMKVYEGPGLIADKADADLIPVQIDGAMFTVFSRMKGKFRTRLFPKITISILPPRKFHPPADTHGRDGRKHMASELYDILVQISVATSDSGRTLFRSLVEAAIRYGHKIEILNDINFRPVTFRKLLAASLFLGRKLCTGTEAGEPVGLLIANSSAAVCSFFGVQSMGRVCAMLNYSTGPANIESACKTARIRVAWTSRKFVELAKIEPLVEAMLRCGVDVRYLEDAAKKTFMDYLRLPFYLRNARWIAKRREIRAVRELRARYGVGGHAFQEGCRMSDVGGRDADAKRGKASPDTTATTDSRQPTLPPQLEAALDNARNMLAAARSSLVATVKDFARYDESALADMPAVILFTSGSSGVPKGVVLSHRNLITNYLQGSVSVDLVGSDRFFSCLPLFHAFGLTGGLIMPLFRGIPAFMYPSPLHYGIIPELIYQTNATIMFATPTFLAGYMRRAHPYDLFSVRYVFSGAEKLKTEVRQFYAEQFGTRIFEAYGSTEASPGICINTPMHNRPGTVGPFLPGIEWRIETVPGIERGGRLWVRGANIMLGYIHAELPGQLDSPPGGWYDTGDIVDVDEDGFVTILGRAKRFAKIAGEMVSLTAVEELASATWPEAFHAALSRPHPQKGEEILLLTNQPEPAAAALLAKARERGISELCVPKVVIYREEIPVLGSGKPDYVTLEKEILN